MEIFVTHITLACVYVNSFVGCKGGDDCGAEGGCKVGGVRGATFDVGENMNVKEDMDKDVDEDEDEDVGQTRFVDDL